MTSAQRKPGQKPIHSWKSAKLLLEQWREDLRTLTVELKQSRVIDTVPIDFVSGEPVEREGKPTTTFRGQLIYFTNADLTDESLRASMRSLLLPTFNRAFLHGSQTSTRVTWGLSKVYNQAELVLSSKVTCTLPRRP